MAIGLTIPDDNGAHSELTSTGFKFGAATVDRVTTLPRGVVCMRIETPKIALNVRVSKTGKVRIFFDSGIELMGMR